jgi:hypothetical protein
MAKPKHLGQLAEGLHVTGTIKELGEASKALLQR